MPRKATWLVIIWNGLIALWVISGVNAIADNCEGLTGASLRACEIGQNVGGGIGLFVIGLVWLVGFLVTGLIWLMSRPQRRLCPTCGRSVKSGEIVCRRCGFDFRMAQPTPVYPAGPPPGWGQAPGQVPPGWNQPPAQVPPGWYHPQQPGPPPGWGQLPDGQPPAPPMAGWGDPSDHTR